MSTQGLAIIFESKEINECEWQINYDHTRGFLHNGFKLGIKIFRNACNRSRDLCFSNFRRDLCNISPNEKFETVRLSKRTNFRLKSVESIPNKVVDFQFFPNMEWFHQVRTYGSHTGIIGSKLRLRQT